MAYDKVVDSSVLDAGLKTIADAIREKGGTSDNLAFPTAMAEAITAIESGGAKIAQGTFTVSENVSSYTVQHNLGVKPKIVFYGLATTASKGISDASNPTYRATLYCEHWTDASIFMFMKTSSLKAERVTTYPSSRPGYVGGINEVSVRLGHDSANASYISFAAGVEYIWFAVG